MNLYQAAGLLACIMCIVAGALLKAGEQMWGAGLAVGGLLITLVMNR